MATLDSILYDRHVQSSNGRRVTQQDVARVAGVSGATVSRALAGDASISAPVRRRVQAVSAQLGYRPNRIARALRRRASQTVGIVVPRLSNPFFPVLVEAIERSLHAAGFGLLLGDSQDDVATEAERIEALVSRQVDGLMVVPCNIADSAGAIARAVEATAVVQVDRAVSDLARDRIGVDSEVGIRLAVDHLRAGGRENVVFVGAAATIPAARERLHGFEQAMSAVGREPQALLGDFSLEWGTLAARRLVEDAQRCDAIVCGNDLIAFGVIRALGNAGLRVPDDIAVVGFDDIAFASVADPPLTTVRQPVEELATGAVRLLMDRLAAPSRQARRIDVAPTLVERASTPAVARR
jgi:LacI family transcriptional regulator